MFDLMATRSLSEVFRCLPHYETVSESKRLADPANARWWQILARGRIGRVLEGGGKCWSRSVQSHQYVLSVYQLKRILLTRSKP